MKKLMFLLAAASLSSVAFAQQKSNSQNVLVGESVDVMEVPVDKYKVRPITSSIIGSSLLVEVHKYCSAISPILVNSRNVLLPLFKYQSANGLLPA